LKNRKDFRQFRVRILLRTFGALTAAAAVIYITYSVLQHVGFADGMVAFFQFVFGINYEAALQLYERTFRRHMDMMILCSFLLIFVGLFRIYLRWLTGYLEAVSRGMDILLEDDSGEVLGSAPSPGRSSGEISLPPELFSIERKMNVAKHRMVLQNRHMREAEQRKNDLIMYLAHDLKTPLASTIGYLNLLRDERQISEELREKYLSIALAKSERLEELINEFLEIARYSLSDIILQYKEINLTRLLEQLVYEFQPILDGRGLTCRLAAEDILLKCDADKMQRVFDNLLRNAALYSYEGTEITIEAGRREENLVLKFSNHGDTIPAKKLERLFEQFYSLDTGRGTGGTGLGLAIARQIVTLHKGTITAESENELTVFTVTLPVL
jgi:two-component system sensor histidine kinase VanS